MRPTTILYRKFMAMVAASLLATGTLPAKVTPLGTVTHADHAYLGLAAASVGSTIYEGDRLSTVDGGAMRISGSGLILQLDTRSSVTLRRTAPAGTVQAELGLGTLIFSVAQGSVIPVLADEALLRPASVASTMAHIRVVSPKELRIYAQRGALDFSYHGESAVIAQGSAYRVLLDPSEKDSAEDSKSGHP